jgi:uncharacterized integral membrane protein
VVHAVWVIKLVFFLLLLMALVYVFATNAGQTVDLTLFGRDYLDLGLFWVVSASFVLGFVAALVGMGLREWRLRRELVRLRKHQAVQDRELEDLRALPLQELSEAPRKDD